MTTVTISLPESLRTFVFNQVKTNGYGNVSEYFRGLLGKHSSGRRTNGLRRCCSKAWTARAKMSK